MVEISQQNGASFYSHPTPNPSESRSKKSRVGSRFEFAAGKREVIDRSIDSNSTVRVHMGQPPGGVNTAG